MLDWSSIREKVLKNEKIFIHAPCEMLYDLIHDCHMNNILWVCEKKADDLEIETYIDSYGENVGIELVERYGSIKYRFSDRSFCASHMIYDYTKAISKINADDVFKML